MKKQTSLLTIVFLSGILFLTAIPTQRAQAQPGAYVSYQDFYDQLSPYGEWINDAEYGYVWVPYAEDGFRPYYTNGYWAMTDYGNTWVSDYPWGWAVFHYGRWIYDSYYGWLWIPGTEWGPAWVSWRYGEGYYGWAPLSPGFNFSVGFDNYYCPDDWWVFLPPHYLYRPRYYNYWHGPEGNTIIIRNTTIINNTYINPHTNTAYITGPRAEEVQRVTNRPVKVYHVTPATAPGAPRVNGDAIALYRPITVQRTLASGSAPAPNNVVPSRQPVGKPQPVGTNTGQRTPYRVATQPNNNNTPVVNPERVQSPVQQQQPEQRNNQQTPVEQQQVQTRHRGMQVQQQYYQPPVQNNQQQQNYQPPQRTYTPPPQPPVQRSYTPPPQQQVQPQRNFTPPVQHSYTPPPQQQVQPQHNFTPPVQVQPQRPNPPSQQQQRH